MSFILLSLFFIATISCSRSNKEISTDKPAQKETTKNSISYRKYINFSIKPEGKLYIGDTLQIHISLPDTIGADSILLEFSNKKIYKTTTGSLLCEHNTQKAKTGKNSVRAIVFIKGKREMISQTLTFLSDISPKTKSYKIINTYPHDKSAYTQGLFYHDGYLYESTGLKGQSTIKKINYKTGDVLQSFKMKYDMFGEGITLYQDKIIQLTYKSRVGFVYDLETFQVLHQFNYPTEGWGITTFDSLLVMGDGTHFLYFLDPTSFSEVRRIEVYDNNGPVDSVNELEYIGNSIYANIYQTDRIIQIEPETGKILAYIDMKGILSDQDKFYGIDVLNGIAYDEKNDRIFVTGKRWPKLFEIEFL